MHFEYNNSLMFSDTLVPDIFITEYMCNVDGDYARVFIYCLFLSKNDKDITINDLSNRLCLDIQKVKQAFLYWENSGVMIKKGNSYVLQNLKEIELHKAYLPKLSASDGSEKTNIQDNITRTKVINAINNSFFQGVMSPSWYTYIDEWFAKFNFDDDVMYSLFQHCFNNKALSKNYIVAVATNWYNKGIKTSAELDSYFMAYEKLTDIKKKITKKLGITNRKLTEYEEAYIDKWVLTYNFDFEIIELALKKTTSKSNPNFDYINAILLQWYQKNLKTVAEIEEFSKQFKETQKLKKENAASMGQLYNKHYNDNQNIDFSQYIDNYKG